MIARPVVMARALGELRATAAAWGVPMHETRLLNAREIKRRIIAAYLRAADADHAEELRRRRAA